MADAFSAFGTGEVKTLGGLDDGTGGIIVLVAFFRLGGGMRIRQNLLLIKANLDRQRERRRTKRIFDNLEVRVSRVGSLPELWTLFGDLAKKFNLKVLELQLPHLRQRTNNYRYQLPARQFFLPGRRRPLPTLCRRNCKTRK